MTTAEFVRRMTEAGASPEAIAIALEYAEGKKAPKAKGERGERLSEDWVMPIEWLEEALEYRTPEGQALTKKEVINEAGRFADYWRAQPGAKGRKANWKATWRNWIRTAGPRIVKARHASGASRSNGYRQYERPSFTDALVRRFAERGEGEPLEGQCSDRRTDLEPDTDPGNLLPFPKSLPF